MPHVAGWWGELRKVLLVFLVAGLVGFTLGKVTLAMLIATLFIVGNWLYQLSRVGEWLASPGSTPPEASGLWGELFDSIYHLQRRDREERDRLQTTVSYLRDSFAALEDGAVMIDTEGAIEWSNEAAARLLGLQYPRDRGQAIVNLLRVPSFNGYFFRGDYSEPLMLRSPADERISLQLEITRFGKGNRLMFARDVTNVERLERMRRDFVANVSHELRTPLTVISGYLQTLRDSGAVSDPRYEKPWSQMENQAERMESLLKDLLLLARLESLEGNIDMAPLDVSGLASEVREESLLSYPGREVVLEIPAGAEVNGNYQQLYSAVLNLVTNALKYSDGAVRIEWQVAERHAALSVVDEGVGVEALHIPRLTERFYRVEGSRSQETGGTGLGLAIVKHVLAAHGGGLEIESEPGVGSRFSCILPL